MAQFSRDCYTMIWQRRWPERYGVADPAGCDHSFIWRRISWLGSPQPRKKVCCSPDQIERVGNDDGVLQMWSRQQHSGDDALWFCYLIPVWTCHPPVGLIHERERMRHCDPQQMIIMWHRWSEVAHCARKRRCGRGWLMQNVVSRSSSMCIGETRAPSYARGVPEKEETGGRNWVEKPKLRRRRRRRRKIRRDEEGEETEEEEEEEEEAEKKEQEEWTGADCLLIIR